MRPLVFDKYYYQWRPVPLRVNKTNYKRSSCHVYWVCSPVTLTVVSDSRSFDPVSWKYKVTGMTSCWGTPWRFTRMDSSTSTRMTLGVMMKYCSCALQDNHKDMVIVDCGRTMFSRQGVPATDELMRHGVKLGVPVSWGTCCFLNQAVLLTQVVSNFECMHAKNNRPAAKSTFG